LADVLLKHRVAAGTGAADRGRGMHRSIAVAAIVFAIAAFALQHSTIAGAFEEPLLLLVMGTLFLVVGKLFAGAERKSPAPHFIHRRA
jgi:hypothetical protein